MPIKQLLLVCYSEPFQPFAIHLADGRALKIPHPEFLSFGSSNRVVTVYDPGGSFDVIALALVTSLRVPVATHKDQRPSS